MVYKSVLKIYRLIESTSNEHHASSALLPPSALHTTPFSLLFVSSKINSLFCLVLAIAAVNASPIAATTSDSQNYDADPAAWEANVVAAGFNLTTPNFDFDWLDFTQTDEIKEHIAISKRQDCDNQAFIVDKTESFIDWDVQMSPVVCATAGDMTITVTDGYSVSNSLTVSAGLDSKIIGQKVGANLGINFSKTWTTTASIAVAGPVKNGNCGVMIWKPTTTRRYGTVMQGCVGAMKKIGTFVGDDRGSGQYAGVSWIAGARAMCVKPGSNPPLSRCQGSGNFV